MGYHPEEYLLLIPGDDIPFLFSFIVLFFVVISQSQEIKYLHHDLEMYHADNDSHCELTTESCIDFLSSNDNLAIIHQEQEREYCQEVLDKDT
jgi:hypothetical protein